MNQIATNEDRLLAAYIRTVAETSGSHEKAMNCLASILVEYRNGRDAFDLGHEIAEHG